MASFKIHADQENRGPELRPKQHKNADTMAAAQHKRTALTVLDLNKANKPAAKGKQPLKEKNVKHADAKQSQKNVVFPVAQFEAFTVYESDEYRARIDQKLKQISKSNVYKGTDEDRFITKSELAEIERKKQDQCKENVGPEVPKAAPMSVECKGVKHDSPDDVSMSVEKTNDENCQVVAQDAALILAKAGAKDVFFEMEEYRHDIYCYLREREMRHRPKAGYILKQPDVTENMRAILVDWLVEVAEEYKMHSETLYLAVNFIDRFLSYMSVVRAKLQLVGTAAMFIAAKYEEIYPPDVNEFVYITDDTYDKNQVIRMEQLILKVLGFDLSIPTPLTLISAICISAKINERTMYLAMYLSELSLLDVEHYLLFLPSMLASSALALARHVLGQTVWDEEIMQKTGYTLKSLECCISFLNDIHQKATACPQHAIQDKYKSTKYLQVANIATSAKPIDFDAKLPE